MAMPGVHAIICILRVYSLTLGVDLHVAFDVFSACGASRGTFTIHLHLTKGACPFTSICTTFTPSRI